MSKKTWIRNCDMEDVTPILKALMKKYDLGEHLKWGNKNVIMPDNDNPNFGQFPYISGAVNRVTLVQDNGKLGITAVLKDKFKDEKLAKEMSLNRYIDRRLAKDHVLNIIYRRRLFPMDLLPLIKEVEVFKNKDVREKNTVPEVAFCSGGRKEKFTKPDLPFGQALYENSILQLMGRHSYKMSEISQKVKSIDYEVVPLFLDGVPEYLKDQDGNKTNFLKYAPIMISVKGKINTDYDDVTFPYLGGQSFSALIPNMQKDIPPVAYGKEDEMAFPPTSPKWGECYRIENEIKYPYL